MPQRRPRFAQLALVAAFVPTLFIERPCVAQLSRPPQDEIIYQIMPIAWRDSNNDSQGTVQTRFGDFGGLASTASLDYLQGLGVTMIYLQPVFPSAAYHGYQHGPGDQLNARFGTQADFQAFINAAHARSMKVILDFVAYGISQNSTFFTSAYGNPSSPYDSWLGFTNAANTQYTGSVYTTWDGESVGFIQWNLANPSVAATVTNYAKKWLDPNNDGDTSDGVDGFRLDHAYSNAPEGWGATIGFWQSFCTSLRAMKPDVFIFCEPGDWGNYGTDLLTPTGFDAVETKPWEFAARDAVLNANASELYNSMASTLGAVPSGKTLVAQTNDHDSDRLASYLGSSNAKQKVAAAVLLTQPLPPNIYFGDEIGMRGVAGNWGTDANDIPKREPFKWFAVAAAPMSNYWILNNQAYTNRTSQNNDGRSVQEEQGVAGSILETYRSLIAVRRNSIALRRGTYSAVTNSTSSVWSFVRYHAEQTVLVAINLGGSSVTTPLNLGSFSVIGGSTVPVDLFSGASLPAITDANAGAYSLTIPAYSWVIASVGLTPPAPPPPPPADIDGRNIPADAGAAALAATQTVGTSFGDNVAELDQMFARASADGLRLGITGNVPTDGTAIIVLIQANPGGQNVLNTAALGSPPAGLAELTGTRLDAGFAPDLLFFINFYGGAVYVDQVNLSASGAVKTFLGSGTVNNGSGLLSGGTNLFGVAAAMNNTNTGGITGTSVANAATATTGLEMLIPYVAAGLPPSPQLRAGRVVQIAAAVVRSSGDFGNQWLPGCPAGTGDLGVAPNMAGIAGSQAFSLTLPHVCGSADFNGDGDVGTDADIEAFFACLAGNCCPTCGSADYNGDGDTGTDADIESFFRVLAGGAC